MLKFLKIEKKLININDISSIERIDDDGKYCVRFMFLSGRDGISVDFMKEKDADDFFSNLYNNFVKFDSIV